MLAYWYNGIANEWKRFRLLEVRGELPSELHSGEFAAWPSELHLEESNYIFSYVFLSYVLKKASIVS